MQKHGKRMSVCVIKFSRKQKRKEGKQSLKYETHGSIDDGHKNQNEHALTVKNTPYQLFTYSNATISERDNIRLPLAQKEKRGILPEIRHLISIRIIEQSNNLTSIPAASS